MSAAPIKRIVILGGGTAGWSAAACLVKFGETRAFEITVADSQTIGTVGVGEASVPNIHRFNAFLGLQELDFIEHTQATFKLGIDFVDWRARGERFFHPFGRYGLDFAGLHFHQILTRARAGGFEAPLESFSLAVELARQGRFSQPVVDKSSPLSEFGYAFHFDAGLYARRLKKYAIERGVRHLDRIVTRAVLNPESGFIEGLACDDGAPPIEGDLFIDCSGFRALLVEGALKTPYDDWSGWLACDRAVAVPSERRGPLLDAYTTATARDAGWTWRIPLQHRTGNGYVFSSAHTSEAAAIDYLLDSLGKGVAGEPNVLKFQSGNRRMFWNKNCVALGLAAGFIEPLESTSINLVHRGLSTLMDYFPDMDFDPRLQAIANRRMRIETENIRDFVILHYKCSGREDSDFWRRCRDMDVPDTLLTRIDAYRAIGELLQYEAESFKPESWLTLYSGLGVVQERPNPDAMEHNPAQFVAPLKAIRASIVEAAAQAMPHGDYIAQFCPAIPLHELF